MSLLIGLSQHFSDLFLVVSGGILRLKIFRMQRGVSLDLLTVKLFRCQKNLRSFLRQAGRRCAAAMSRFGQL